MAFPACRFMEPPTVTVSNVALAPAFAVKSPWPLKVVTDMSLPLVKMLLSVTSSVLAVRSLPAFTASFSPIAA
ncbi:hypothetical protein D3C81_1035690 [compost metagenome]